MRHSDEILQVAVPLFFCCTGIKPADPVLHSTRFAVSMYPGAGEGLRPFKPRAAVRLGEPMTKPERKTTTASLRLDPATLAKWRKGASDEGQTLSDWLRAKVDADQQTHISPARSRRERDPRHLADPALMRQLAALGSNLNQIARAVNECRLVGSPVHLVELLALLRSIEERAGALLPQLPPPPNREGDGHDD